MYMNEEIITVLNSYKQALDYLNEQNKALNDKIDELSAVLYDDILSPVQDTLNYIQDEESFGNFKDQYGEQLEPYSKEYAALYDGNDIARDVYDTYKENADKYDEAAFVEEATRSIADTIQATKEALGIPADVPVKVTATETESTPDNPDGVEVEVEPAEPVTEKEAEEAETKVEKGADEAEAEEEAAEEAIDDPEEVAAYEAELEKQLKR